MEIISYVLDGALEHKDSLGNGATIRPGEVQRMTAGTGITHSEYNPSPSQSVHFLQIWILPDREGLPPGYEQRFFPSAEKQGRLRLVASPDGSNESVTVHQDARLYVSHLGAGDTVLHDIRPGRHAWLQVASGTVTLNGQSLVAGDGAAVSDEQRLEIGADTGSEVLLFDLA
jgi:redox-sensitive bicupin YhaK (pirin superfamily)